MPALALVTVKTYDANTVNRQEILSFDHVTQYQAQGTDTFLKYNPTQEGNWNAVVLDDTYASFNSAFENKVNSVGVPMYFISEGGELIGQQRVVKSDNIIRIIQNADGVTSTLVYFNQNFIVKSAQVNGTLASIYAAQYNPAAAISSEIYRDGTITSNTVGPHTIPVPFSEFGDDTYDIYLTDLTGMGLDSASAYASRTTTSFEIDALDGGTFGWLIVKKVA